MPNHPLRLRFCSIACLIFLTVFCTSCSKNSGTTTAFYYWKQNFNLNKTQVSLLNNTGNGKLYVRFFDIKWDPKANCPYPEAVLHFGKLTPLPDITPVIFITNQTFEKLAVDDLDSLAVKSNALIEKLAKQQQLAYKAIQIDCDWTIGTKEKYFSFLKTLKKISKKSLESTIRLHQVKYQFKTGVPPVDRGILMFYNMGKLSADPAAANSIYNAKDATPYLSSLPNYLLPLDIALPVFSWSIQIRDGKIIQVYGKIGRNELNNTTNFKQTAQKDVYVATNSFFTGGIYVKAGDIFKLEESNKKTLEGAAKQLSSHLNKKDKRTIIYYELGNLNLSAFKAADFKEISTYF
ncbi:hypothetical protein SAMN04488524_1297 [Pedobacter africanus]|uniref:Lipoprotein n=1 Tax=Pedobacter africanus TaxID=151894 RepID=A0A1W2ACG4_9SPHI|nr:hypothetical protein SAMN04488524_1297 [Pedobacter africanus]